TPKTIPQGELPISRSMSQPRNTMKATAPENAIPADQPSPNRRAFSPAETGVNDSKIKGSSSLAGSCPNSENELSGTSAKAFSVVLLTTGLSADAGLSGSASSA